MPRSVCPQQQPRAQTSKWPRLGDKNTGLPSVRNPRSCRAFRDVRVLSIVLRDDFAARTSGQRRQGANWHGYMQEPDRAVDKDRVGAAWVVGVDFIGVGAVDRTR